MLTAKTWGPNEPKDKEDQNYCYLNYSSLCCSRTCLQLEQSNMLKFQKVVFENLIYNLRKKLIYSFSIVVSSITTFTLGNTQIIYSQEFSNISSNKQGIQAVSQGTHSTLRSPIWRVIIIITYRLGILLSDNTTG